MSSSLVKSFQKALEAGVPLIGVNTADPGLTIRTLAQSRPASLTRDPYALLQWDVINGLTLTHYEQVLREEARAPETLNSEAVLKGLTADNGGTWMKNLVTTLQKLRAVPENTTIFVHNAHRFLHDTGVMQALWLLRDQFKAGAQTMVMLGPHIKLPQELTYDVLILEDPLPQRDELQSVLNLQYTNARGECPTIPEPTSELLDNAVDAITGLSGFAAEQAIAMAFTTKGLDLVKLWDRKYEAIEQTPGLRIYRGKERFADVGGVSYVKTFLSKIVNGQRPPKATVFMDEIEKVMSGANSQHGDNTGVSQDLHRQLLEFMQNTDATGILMLGAPGTSKSMISKAVGNEAGIPTIELDLGAIKAGQVGASEQNMRQALKIISSISNGDALFLATCNSIDALSPELRRRFRLGTFVFPLPTAEEREAIWNIYVDRYSLDKVPSRLLKEPWTGAEIRQCADIAWRLKISLEDAAQYIVPVAISAKASIDDLYTKADGAFLSASYAGPFRKDRLHDGSTKSAPRQRGRKMHFDSQPAGMA